MRASRTLRRSATTPAVLGVAVLAALAAVIMQLPSGSGLLRAVNVTPQAKAGGGNGGGPARPATFEVKGSAAGLFPGSAFDLPVKIENPYHFAISVQAVDVTVGSPTSSSCHRSNVRVDDLPAPVVVAPNGETFTNLTIRMRNDPPDGCKSATFPLAFTSRAVKA